jgi:hypothetical protein
MNRLKQSISGIQTPSLPSFGRAQEDENRPTPPPLPLSTLQLIQLRRSTTSDVQSTYLVLHKTLAKQRPDARGGSKLQNPAKWVAEAMVEGSEGLAGLAELSDAQQAYGKLETSPSREANGVDPFSLFFRQVEHFTSSVNCTDNLATSQQSSPKLSRMAS